MTDYFNGTPDVGLQVFWYPMAQIDGDTVPRIGFINRGWSRGVADISVLPAQDGAVEVQDHVFHIGDPRLRDVYGKVSAGGIERGCWDFTPLSRMLLKLEAEEAGTDSESEAEPKGKRATSARK